MSTKIWTAWRVPKTRLNEALDTLHDHYWKQIVKHFGLLIDAVDVVKLKEKYPKLDETNKKSLAWYAGWEVTDTLTKINTECKAKHTPLPSNFDMCVSFNIWLHGKYAYIIPYAPYGWTESFDRRLPKWFEDFHYQNQTDRPDDITAREWSNRARVWNNICLGDYRERTDWNARRLTYTVYENDTGFMTALTMSYEGHKYAKRRKAKRG